MYNNDIANLTKLKDNFSRIPFIFETFYEIYEDYLKMKKNLEKEKSKLHDLEKKLEKFKSKNVF